MDSTQNLSTERDPVISIVSSHRFILTDATRRKPVKEDPSIALEKHRQPGEHLQA